MTNIDNIKNIFKSDLAKEMYDKYPICFSMLIVEDGYDHIVLKCNIYPGDILELFMDYSDDLDDIIDSVRGNNREKQSLSYIQRSLYEHDTDEHIWDLYTSFNFYDVIMKSIDPIMRKILCEVLDITNISEKITNLAKYYYDSTPMLEEAIYYAILNNEFITFAFNQCYLQLGLYEKGVYDKNMTKDNFIFYFKKYALSQYEYIANQLYSLKKGQRKDEK